MPISSRARKREGSETIAQASRSQAGSKPLAPTMWGEEIVQSSRKRLAVQQAFDGNWNMLYGARIATPREYLDLGGFGLVHTDATNARIVMWDSAA